MDFLNDLADDRLVSGCIYCGGMPDTREHVPSRVLLDAPLPGNLPIVGACRTCNNGFSKDEEYVACLVEVVLAGTTDPDLIRRATVAKALRRSSALRNRLEAGRSEQQGRVVFAVEQDRVRNVMIKLARGHAVFELSQMRSDQPDYFWCLPLESLDAKERDAFEAAHVVSLLGEVGSRSTQRMQAAVVTMVSPAGDTVEHLVLLNDWVEVQEGRYRYLAIDEGRSIRIKIVVAEYLACEAIWLDDEDCHPVLPSTGR